MACASRCLDGSASTCKEKTKQNGGERRSTSKWKKTRNYLEKKKVPFKVKLQKEREVDTWKCERM